MTTSISSAYAGVRTFNIFGRFRFKIPSSRQNVLETMVDGAHTLLEYAVYLLGPFLICLALGIISFLGYSFFMIMVPMISRNWSESRQKYLIVALHVTWVLFVLFNILYNYAYCVMTKHRGMKYDSLVREFASASNITYPETPLQLESYRRDYNALMSIRVKRHQQKIQQNHSNNSLQISQSTTTPSDSQQESTYDNTMITRRLLSTTTTNTPGSTGSTTKETKKIPSSHSIPSAQATTQLRPWMMMSPFEWGYCAITQQPKPPRSHYDNVTNTLVLNLDHYCPWMFNSIGYFNYRYFLNFLIYVFVGMLYGAIISSKPFFLCKSMLYRKQIAYERSLLSKGELQSVESHMIERIHPMMPTRDEKMYITLAFMLCAAVGIAVSILCGFHIYLTLSGQTTIEFHANHARRRRAKDFGQKWSNPYSLQSWTLNWQQVYGKCSAKNMLCIFSSLLPSNRERDYYPAPIPGNAIRPSACKQHLRNGCDNDVRSSLQRDDYDIQQGTTDENTNDGLLGASLSSENKNTGVEV
jgi:palmitoyltransferase